MCARATRLVSAPPMPLTIKYPRSKRSGRSFSEFSHAKPHGSKAGITRKRVPRDCTLATRSKTGMFATFFQPSRVRTALEAGVKPTAYADQRRRLPDLPITPEEIGDPGLPPKRRMIADQRRFRPARQQSSFRCNALRTKDQFSLNCTWPLCGSSEQEPRRFDLYQMIRLCGMTAILESGGGDYACQIARPAISISSRLRALPATTRNVKAGVPTDRFRTSHESLVVQAWSQVGAFVAIRKPCPAAAPKAQCTACHSKPCR